MNVWVSIKDRLPTKGGKYIVSCVGTHQLNPTKNRFEAFFIFNEETGKGSFDVSNQVVVSWLDEIKKIWIACSAIWAKNYGLEEIHQPKNITEGIVFCGLRHHNCINTFAIANLTACMKEEYEQGFLTSDNRFVSREEAAKIAFEAGQIDEPVDRDSNAFRVSDRSGTPQAGNPAEEYSGERDPEALRGDTPKKNTAQ